MYQKVLIVQTLGNWKTSVHFYIHHILNLPDKQCISSSEDLLFFAVVRKLLEVYLHCMRYTLIPDLFQRMYDK